jgi:hypothetical protein
MNSHKSKGWGLTISVTLLILFFADFSDAEIALPNGTLSVAYRQQVEGKLSQGVHQVELSCWNGVCSLTTLTLNQCWDWKDGKGGSFYPKVQRASTAEGDLVVMPQSETSLIAEQKFSDTVFRYRFSYTVRTDQELQASINLRSAQFFEALTGFSGAVVKTSSILDKIISWELVPLQGRFPRLKLDCDVTLDGVPE